MDRTHGTGLKWIEHMARAPQMDRTHGKGLRKHGKDLIGTGGGQWPLL